MAKIIPIKEWQTATDDELWDRYSAEDIAASEDFYAAQNSAEPETDSVAHAGMALRDRLKGDVETLGSNFLSTLNPKNWPNIVGEYRKGVLPLTVDETLESIDRAKQFQHSLSTDQIKQHPLIAASNAAAAVAGPLSIAAPGSVVARTAMNVADPAMAVLSGLGKVGRSAQRAAVRKIGPAGGSIMGGIHPGDTEAILAAGSDIDNVRAIRDITRKGGPKAYDTAMGAWADMAQARQTSHDMYRSAMKEQFAIHGNQPVDISGIQTDLTNALAESGVDVSQAQQVRFKTLKTEGKRLTVPGETAAERTDLLFGKTPDKTTTTLVQGEEQFPRTDVKFKKVPKAKPHPDDVNASLMSGNPEQYINAKEATDPRIVTFVGDTHGPSTNLEYIKQRESGQRNIIGGLKKAGQSDVSYVKLPDKKRTITLPGDVETLLDFDMSEYGSNLQPLERVYLAVENWPDQTVAGLDRLKKKLDDLWIGTEKGSRADQVLASVRNQLRSKLSEATRDATGHSWYDDLTSQYQEQVNLAGHAKNSLGMQFTGRGADAYTPGQDIKKISGNIDVNAMTSKTLDAEEALSEFPQQVVNEIESTTGKPLAGPLAAHRMKRFFKPGSGAGRWQIATGLMTVGGGGFMAGGYTGAIVGTLGAAAAMTPFTSPKLLLKLALDAGLSPQVRAQLARELGRPSIAAMAGTGVRVVDVLQRIDQESKSDTSSNGVLSGLRRQ